MNTITLRKPIVVLSFVWCSTLGCDVPGKQIGQLDAEESESGSEIADGDDGSEISASCSDAIEHLVSTFEAGESDRCALLVSFDYETFEVTGWNFMCGPGDLDLDETEARALTTWGGDEISEPMDEPDNDRSFIFYQAPGDEGGVGWVSNHVGLLFDASIMWDGTGEIHYPDEFADPSELGSGCTPFHEEQIFELRGYDLTKQNYVTDYLLPEGHPLALMNSLLDTAIVHAARQSFGGVFYLDFLAYPRSVGEFDPSAAEYMLVLEWWDGDLG